MINKSLSILLACFIVLLTTKNWKLINQVNHFWNNKLRYQSDIIHYGELDHWTIPVDGRGDCEDYALAKQKELSDNGIASYMAICKVKRDKSVHAVLIIKTDLGDFVLDNRYFTIWGVSDLNYNWLKIEGEKGKWYDILQF